MLLAGSLQVGQLTRRAGTPAAVQPAGTAFSTTEPGPDIAPYHDRQIVILPRRDWAAWLAPAPEFPPLGPLPAGSLKVTQIR